MFMLKNCFIFFFIVMGYGTVSSFSRLIYIFLEGLL